MKRQLNLPYNKAKPLINEADVLLFRGTGWGSYFISRAGKSPYTHVGMASWHNGDENTLEGLLECVEFREGSPIAGLFNANAAGGGRSVNLEREVNKYPGQIDVYRPVKFCSEWHFNSETHEAVLERRQIDPKAITKTMRKMTGLPYGWKRIWWIAKHNLLGFRLFTDVKSLENDELGEVVYPVCSTAIAYSFNKNGYDLIHNKADQWAEPADIARSARLSYLFTLDP